MKRITKLLLILLLLPTACQAEKCVRVVDESNKSVDVLVYKIEGNRALSMNPLGTFVGASKEGEICISNEGGLIFKAHYRIAGIGNYEEKYFDNFNSIPSTITLIKKMHLRVKPQ